MSTLWVITSVPALIVTTVAFLAAWDTYGKYTDTTLKLDLVMVPYLTDDELVEEANRLFYVYKELRSKGFDKWAARASDQAALLFPEFDARRPLGARIAW